MRFIRRRRSMEEPQTSNLVNAGSTPVGGTIGYLRVDGYVFEIKSITLDAANGIILSSRVHRPPTQLSGPIQVLDKTGTLLVEGTDIMEFPPPQPGVTYTLTYAISIDQLRTADGWVPATPHSIEEES